MKSLRVPANTSRNAPARQDEERRPALNSKRSAACMALLAWAAIAVLPAAGSAQAAGPGKVEAMTLRIGDVERSFVRYVPVGTKVGQPLVVVLHGTFGNGQAMRHDTDFGFERLADQHGFVVLYPDALMSSWNDCRQPNSGRKLDDVGFLRQAIRSAVAEYGSDPANVFLFGFSGGAHMAYRMAWEAPQDIAAIAAVAGNLPPPNALTCVAAGKTPRVLMVKGRADTGDPYDGGPHALSGSVLSARQSAAAFAQQNGLLEPAAEVDAGPGTRLLAWPASGRPQVALYSVDGLAHMVPVGWRDKADGVALAWKFFTAP